MGPKFPPHVGKSVEKKLTAVPSIYKEVHGLSDSSKEITKSFGGTHKEFLLSRARPIVPGGSGDAMAPPDFGRSINPISTRGADYAQHIITGTPRIFRPSYGPEATESTQCENVYLKVKSLKKVSFHKVNRGNREFKL